MDVVEQFLEARRHGNASEAIDLVAPNASLSFPWGGLRNGESAKNYLQNEASFAHKQYLSSSVQIKEVAPNTFQRIYKWDKCQLETYSSGWMFGNKLLGGKGLPTYREVYFVRDGKIAHVATNKDPARKSFYDLITFNLNPFATGPVILHQDTKL